MRDGFIIHEKTLRQMSMLEPEDRGYLMGLLSDYYYGTELDIDKVAAVSPIVAVILIDATERMDADASAYDDAAERRIKSAQKAAAARWSKGTPSDAENAVASNRICETDAENAVSVSVSVSDSVSVPVSEKKTEQKKSGRFTPPTLEEVETYCQERKNGIDAGAFIAYYESQGWKKANGRPVVDWKGCVRTWEQREKPAREPPKPPEKNKYTPKGEYFNFSQRNYDFNALEKALLTKQKGEKVELSDFERASY